MQNKQYQKIGYVALIIALLLASPAYAWEHSISFGYGKSQELGYSYDNSGYFLNGVFTRFQPLDPMLYFSIDGSAGFWTASTNQHRQLTTLAASGDFHAYFTPPADHQYRPYLLGTFGPAYLSQEQFGEETQGSHIAFQTTLGGGLEYVKQDHGVDLNLRLIHYCNAGLASPNEGFDIFYVFSVGYLF